MSRKIECVPLAACHLDIAAEMAQSNYIMERKSVPALPGFDNRAFYRSRIGELAERGTGRVALRDGVPAGFLLFGDTFACDGGGKGAASPLYGYGVRDHDRGRVMEELFQSAAKELAEKYIGNLTVTVYAHDRSVFEMYLMSAFAMDTTDAVRNIGENTPLPALEFREVSKAELLGYREEISELYRGLINHLRVSPIFYHCRPFLPLENRWEDFLGENLRIFAVFDRDRLVGMLNSEPADIPFTASDEKARSMGDVFIDPGYRGRGLGEALLGFAAQRLKGSGFERLFVTHGTINPAARRFWDRHFANYSYTMTRVIDREMLGVIDPV